MVIKEELEDSEEFEDLLADIRGECEKFGALDCVVMPRTGEQEVDNGVGKVFLKYKKLADAVEAPLL